MIQESINKVNVETSLKFQYWSLYAAKLISLRRKFCPITLLYKNVYIYMYILQ